MNTKTVNVTPKLAAEWLKTNHGNRPLNRHYVDEVSRALEDGSFQTTHQGIAFDEKGRLRDGQHRLTAIVETSIAVKIQVTTGLTEEQLMVIDDGRRRSFFNVVGMTGNDASSFCTRVVREMCIGGYHFQGTEKPKRPGRLELMGFFDLHWKAAAFAETFFPKTSKGFHLPFLAAVVARAYYTADKERLKRFSVVLVEGFHEKGEEVIIRLRNIIQEKRLESRKKSPAMRDELYAKSERVLWDWLNGDNPETIHFALEELFPLPGEESPINPQATKKVKGRPKNKPND